MHKILILAAIPQGLRLDKEICEIESAIQRAVNRDLFEIRIKTAVSPQDIRRAIAEEEPQIVHFCGHGLEDGSLVLEDDGGNHKAISPEVLASLFELHADYVKCVLLNACYSEHAAEAIKQYIDYVIGMNSPIQDQAAIEFAKGFYDGLGYKHSGNQDLFQRAFKEGMVAIELENFSQGSIPVLKTKVLLETVDEQHFRLQEASEQQRFPSLLDSSFFKNPDIEERYTSIELITKGLFTNVYKAKNKHLEHFVIIKQLHYEPIKDKFKTTIKDAFTISEISNFITIYDYYDYLDKSPFYVMRFIEGETLREKLKTHPKRWTRDSKKSWIEDVLKIILKIGYALLEARKKVKLKYYLNIKPSNIILDIDNEPYISAFNVCVNFDSTEIIQELERLKEKHLKEGKFEEELAYLLPEKFNDSYSVTERTDQYMLGLLAYELLTGKIPPSIQDFETLKNDCSKAFKTIAFPDSPSEDCKILEDIILKMTALNPDDRYNDLREALEILHVYIIFRDKTKDINLVKESYKRCIKNSKFYQTLFEQFYKEFRKHSEVDEKFSKFDQTFWKNHHKLVEQTILLFFWYYEEKSIFFRLEPITDEKFNFLDYIVESHAHINISEDLFDFFKNTLIKSVIKYDNKCNEESYKALIKRAWEEVLTPGFEYIKLKSQQRTQNVLENIPQPKAL